MENILKLTVKKDVFDNLASGKQSYIYVEGNGYWIRRLATNTVDSFEKLKETQDFRTFDTVSVTCAKDNAIYPFKSIRTGNAYEGDNDAEDDGFKIWVEMNEYHNVDKETENIQECENVNEPNEELESVDESNEIDIVNKPNDETEIDATEKFKNESVEDVVKQIIDVFDGYDNVVVVNRPFVTITSNGRIFGTNKRLNINNDEEIRINIGQEKIYDDTNNDESFIDKIEQYLVEYVKSGHVLIYKNGCRLVNTPNGRYMLMKMTKKMYLNR